jgi:hypothetical protein
VLPSGSIDRANCAAAPGGSETLNGRPAGIRSRLSLAYPRWSRPAGMVCAQWHANSRAVGVAPCPWIERWSVCEALLASAAMSRDHGVLHAGRARDEIAASESPHTCKFARPWCTSARQTCECPDRSAPPPTPGTHPARRGTALDWPNRAFSNVPTRARPTLARFVLCQPDRHNLTRGHEVGNMGRGRRSI